MKASDWIKVEDILPQEYTDLLVYDDMQGVLVATYEKHAGWVSYEHGVLEAVTHWTPLELPKKTLWQELGQ